MSEGSGKSNLFLYTQYLMSACLPNHVLFIIMYIDNASAYHGPNDLFEDPSGIYHLMKLLTIILVERLTRRRMITCGDKGTVLV